MKITGGGGGGTENWARRFPQEASRQNDTANANK